MIEGSDRTNFYRLMREMGLIEDRKYYVRQRKSGKIEESEISTTFGHWFDSSYPHLVVG